MFEHIETSKVQEIEIIVEGKPYKVPERISVAAAVLLCGLDHVRETPVSGASRSPYCMMGVCFDCLMKIDGMPNQRACQLTVEPGMDISIQKGAVDLEVNHEAAL